MTNAAYRNLNFYSKLLCLVLSLGPLLHAETTSSRCQSVVSGDSITKRVTWTGAKEDENYRRAIKILEKNPEINISTTDIPSITFKEFVEGIAYMKDILFDDVSQFVKWKSQDWKADSHIGTKGYKALEIAVAVKLNDGTVKPAKLFLFDTNGDHGDHKSLAINAIEAFSREADGFEKRYESLYHAQVIISKLKDKPYVEFLHSDNYNLRVYAQSEDFDTNAPISPKWGSIEKQELPK